MWLKMPYVTESVLGEIYEINDDVLALNEISVYDTEDERWSMLSYTNNYGFIELDPDTIIIKNSQVIDVGQLQLGDRLRVMTDIDMQEALVDDDNRKCKRIYFNC